MNMEQFIAFMDSEMDQARAHMRDLVLRSGFSGIVPYFEKIADECESKDDAIATRALFAVIGLGLCIRDADATGKLK